MTVALADSTPGANVASGPKPRFAPFELIPVQNEAEEIAIRIEELHGSYPADGAYQDFLVRQLAVCSMRLDRSVWQEWRVLGYEAKRAELVWDEDRELQAIELADRLPKNPAKVARALEDSLHGLKWMIGRWEFLGKLAEAGQVWNDDRRASALDLLGQPLDLRDVDFSFDHDAALQARVARQEIHRLRERIPMHEAIDARDRALTIEGLGPHLSATLRAHRRFESQTSRMFYRLLDMLNARRREDLSAAQTQPPCPPAAPPPAPVARPPAQPERPAPRPTAASERDRDVFDGPRELPVAPQPLPISIPVKPAPLFTQAPNRPESRRDRRTRKAQERRR